MSVSLFVPLSFPRFHDKTIFIDYVESAEGKATFFAIQVLLHPSLRQKFLQGSIQVKGENCMRKRVIALALCAGLLLLGGCGFGEETADSLASPFSESASQIKTEQEDPQVSEPESVAGTDSAQEISGIIAMTSEISGDSTFHVFSIDPIPASNRACSASPIPAMSEKRPIICRPP